MAYIAGHFSGFFSLTDFESAPSYLYIGSTESGFEQSETNHYEPVHDDAFGDSEPDGVNMGVDTIVRCTWIEYNKIRIVLNQFSTLGVSNSNVGDLLSTQAGTLVLTPAPGTPAATEIGTGMSRVYYRAILIGDVTFALSSKLRKGPLTWKCLPDPSQTPAYKWGIITTPSGCTVANVVGPPTS